MYIPVHPCTFVTTRVHPCNPYIQESRYIHQHIFSVRWQKNGHDYKYMNFGRERFALKCPLYSHSSALEKMIKKKKMGDYMDRVESLAYNRTSKSINRLYRWQWYWWHSDFCHQHQNVTNIFQNQHSMGPITGNILGEIDKMPYNVYNMEVRTLSYEIFMVLILNFRPFTIFETIPLKLIIFSIQKILNKCILMRLKRSRNGQRINWNAGIVMPQAGFQIDSWGFSE